MNLYDLHDNAKDLHKHEAAEDVVPELIMAKYRSKTIHLLKYKNAFKKNAKDAYEFALATKRPFKEAEDIIAKDTYYAYAYAKNVLNKPWPKGEDAIAQTSLYAIGYAMGILMKRFPKGEEAIARSPDRSLQYALYVLHGPFPAGEEAIFKVPQLKRRYDAMIEDSKKSS